MADVVDENALLQAESAVPAAPAIWSRRRGVVVAAAAVALLLAAAAAAAIATRRLHEDVQHLAPVDTASDGKVQLWDNKQCSSCECECSFVRSSDRCGRPDGTCCWNCCCGQAIQYIQPNYGGQDTHYHTVAVTPPYYGGQDIHYHTAAVTPPYYGGQESYTYVSDERPPWWQENLPQILFAVLLLSVVGACVVFVRRGLAKQREEEAPQYEEPSQKSRSCCTFGGGGDGGGH